MTMFDAYSEYYDLIYEDKDYAGETEYILSLMDDHSRVNSVLELGCGTGRHAYHLAKFGKRVLGIDNSEKMIARARTLRKDAEPDLRNRLEFAVADIRSFNAMQTYDSVISLFHVMSYQTSDEDLESAIQVAKAHLNHRGIFIFDFWYGPGVSHDPPEIREKTMKNARCRVVRRAYPESDYDANTVNVKYNITVELLGKDITEEICEEHKMRYFFLPKLRSLLKANNFSDIQFVNWMEHKTLSDTSWYGCCIAR